MDSLKYAASTTTSPALVDSVLPHSALKVGPTIFEPSTEWQALQPLDLNSAAPASADAVVTTTC